MLHEPGMRMLRLQTPGAYQTLLVVSRQAEVFFSYDTPVAAYVTGRGCLRARECTGETTLRHIDTYIGTRSFSLVPQSEIESLLLVKDSSYAA